MLLVGSHCEPSAKVAFAAGLLCWIELEHMGLSTKVANTGNVN